MTEQAPRGVDPSRLAQCIVDGLMDRQTHGQSDHYGASAHMWGSNITDRQIDGVVTWPNIILYQTIFVSS